MSGYKTFANNELLTAADLNGYLMAQTIARVDAAGRDAILVPEVGQVVERTDLNIGERWNGSAWKKFPLRWTGCHLVKDIAQGWVSAYTNVTWSTAESPLDTHDFYNPAINTRVTMPFNGWYRIRWSLLSTGVQATNCVVHKNGAVQFIAAGSGSGVSGAGTNPQGSGIIQLAAGDYLELRMVSPSATGSGAWNPPACTFDIDYLGE